MGAVVLPTQSDPGDPFVNEPGILPGADMIGMINPAWEGVVIESASSTFAALASGLSVACPVPASLRSAKWTRR
jgi:hypothetical protein